MTQNRVLIFVTVTTLLLAIVYFKNGEPVRDTSPQSLNPNPKANAQIIDLKTPQVSKEQIGKLNFQQLVQRDKAEKSIGLKRMPLEVDGGKASLKVVLKLKPSCSPGDADAILQELTMDPSHKLLATFEDITGKEKGLSWEVPETLLKNGIAETVFKVPVKPEPSQYGFFLCTAKKNDSTCIEKEVSDINTIFTEHLTQNSSSEEVVRNIFFQYFIVDERGLATFTRIPKFDGPYQNLKQYLNDVNAPGKSNRAEIDAMKENLQTLDSLPSIFSQGTLVLELPKFRETACQ